MIINCTWFCVLPDATLQFRPCSNFYFARSGPWTDGLQRPKSCTRPAPFNCRPSPEPKKKMTKDRNGLQRRGKWLQFDLQDRSTSVWLGGNGNGSKRTRADRLNKDVVACCCCTASFFFCWYLISLIHFVLFSTFLVPLLTWSGFVALRIFSQHITAYIWNI